MRILAALIAILALSGCALLMPATMSGTLTFTDPAGYRITCSSGPVPIATDPQSFEVEDCTRIAEDGVATFLAQHPGATVDSVTVEDDTVTSVCYTLDGALVCVSVPE